MVQYTVVLGSQQGADFTAKTQTSGPCSSPGPGLETAAVDPIQGAAAPAPLLAAARTLTVPFALQGLRDPQARVLLPPVLLSHPLHWSGGHHHPGHDHRHGKSSPPPYGPYHSPCPFPPVPLTRQPNTPSSRVHYLAQLLHWRCSQERSRKVFL